MFMIEGMDKIREMIEKNRKRKLTKYKKLSNHRIIEIDNCSLLDLLKLQKNLMVIAESEGMEFVYGKGRKRSEIRQFSKNGKFAVKNSCNTKNVLKSWGKIVTVIPKHT